MKLQVLISSACLLLIAVVSAQPQIELQAFAAGLESPVVITHAGDSRLFVVERAGRIRIIDSLGNLQSQAFLDIDPIVQNTGGQSEQGLLGLAFHPNYAENGYFYVNYIANDNHTRISRFSVLPTNPAIADPNSEQLILFIQQPFLNHNGGNIAFGPDGYLYIGMGDGGSANDPDHRAQNPQTLIGKMLRIDVDNGSPYTIPPDNPYAADDFTLDEIWAFGLRNPWRFSFDRLTGDLWIGDVGQGQWEEINFEAAGGSGGQNYGWRCFEGTSPYLQQNCLPDSSFAPPFWQYDHQGFTHCSVTGGFVYRGSEHPGLYGQYIYADFCSGQLWLLRQDDNGVWSDVKVGQYASLGISTFGEDRNGELYLASLSEGRIYKIGLNCSDLLVEAEWVDESCLGSKDGSIQLTVSTAADTFDIVWWDGSTDLNRSDLSTGEYGFVLNDTRGCVWRDTFQLVHGTPAPPLLQSPDVMSICEGQQLILHVSSPPIGYEAEWSHNGTPLTSVIDQDSLVVSTAGAYTVRFKGTCLSDFSNAVEIEVLPVPQIAGPLQLAICHGDTIDLQAISYVDLNATGAELVGVYDHYPLPSAPPLGTALIAPDSSKSYFLRFMDGQEVCESVDSIWIEVYPSPQSPSLIQNGNILYAGTGYNSYQWFWNGQAISGAISDTFEVLESGEYYVEVLDSNACEAVSAILSLTITPTTALQLSQNFQLSPNPFSDDLYLHYFGQEPVALFWNMYDLSGKKVEQGRAELPSQSQLILPLEHLKNGLYFLQLIGEKGMLVRKVLKKGAK